MNWEAIGALAELIGAAGVIVSLIYLAVQIRTQSRATYLSTVNESARQWNEVLASTAHDPKLCDIWVAGINNFQSLNITDRVQFTAHAGRIFRIIESLYLHYRKGGMDSEGWEAINNSLAELCGYNGTREWWSTRSHWYTRSFQNYVKDLMDATDNDANMYNENEIRAANKSLESGA